MGKWLCMLLCLGVVAAPIRAGVPMCDLSAVSEVLSPALPLEVQGPPGTVHHEIAIPEGCPKEVGAGGNVMPNGDGDGDGADDDRQLDINGNESGRAEMATNGNVELWCINPQANPVGGYYALQFVPAGGGAPRFVGKCPFEGGWNLGWKFINPRTGDIEEMHWQSIDHGKDDDGDGSEDKWFYVYKPGPNTLEEQHFENEVQQGDGRGPAAPPVRPFNFGDLLPRNPRQDDPTEVAFEEPMGEMTGALFDLHPGSVEVLLIATHVANDGPCASEDAQVSVTVNAPLGCRVNGLATAVDQQVVPVGAEIQVFESLFTFECDVSGIQVFDIITQVSGSTSNDPVPQDDRSAGTFTVNASGIFEDAFETGNLLRWSVVR